VNTSGRVSLQAEPRRSCWLE